MIKQTVSKGITYRYWYVKHTINKRIKWCYIGKTLPEQYQKLIHSRSTQKGTQNNRISEKLNLSSFPRTQPVLRSRGWELNPYIAALQAAA